MSSDISDREIKDGVIELEGKKPEEVRMDITNGASEGTLMARFTRNGEAVWVTSNGNGSVDPEDLSFKSGKVMSNEQARTVMAKDYNYLTLLKNGKITPEGQALQGHAERLRSQTAEQPQEPQQNQKPENQEKTPQVEPETPKTTSPGTIDISGTPLDLEKMQKMSNQEIYDYGRQAQIDYVAKQDQAAARSMQLVHDNPDKTIFLDTRDGTRVTVFDGDRESIKPILADQYEQAVEKVGGVDALIELHRARLQEAGIPQAVIDKEAELMKAADGNGEKFADLRFASNAEFTKLAQETGHPNAEHVNDVTNFTRIETSLVGTEPGEEGSAPEETASAPEKPEPYDFDEKYMVKLAEGGELTNVGRVTLVAGVLPGMGMMENIHESARMYFDNGIKEHGSVEAFAKHIETEGAPEFEQGSNDPKVRQTLADGVRNSGGDSAVFAASALESINEMPEQPGVKAPAAEAVGQAATQTPKGAEQDTLGAATLFASLQDNMSQIQGQQGNMMQLFEPFMKFLTALMSGTRIDVAAKQLHEGLEGTRKTFAAEFGGKEAEGEEAKVASTEKDAKNPEAKGEDTKLASTEHSQKAPETTQKPEAEQQASAQTPRDPNGVYWGTQTAAGEPLVDDKTGRRFTFEEHEDGTFTYTPVKPEQMPGYKPPAQEATVAKTEPAEQKADDNVHVSYKAPEEGTGAGKPVVNQDPEPGQKHVTLADGKTLTEGANKAMQGEGCTRDATKITELAAAEAQKELEQQQPEADGQRHGVDTATVMSL